MGQAVDLRLVEQPTSRVRRRLRVVCNTRPSLFAVCGHSYSAWRSQWAASCRRSLNNGHFSARYMSIASLTTQARETFLSRAICSRVLYVFGEKPIVTRTLAMLGAFFFTAALFAFWDFPLEGTVCHHTGAIEHKSQVGSRWKMNRWPARRG